MQAVSVRIDYTAYGPHGRTWQRQDVVLPLQFPGPNRTEWKE